MLSIHFYTEFSALSYHILIVVDAAAEIPPVENIHRHLKLGADLVIFSGGKELRGPQSSGLILGRRDLIEACNENSCPLHSVGRGMKVDKETMILPQIPWKLEVTAPGIV